MTTQLHNYPTMHFPRANIRSVLWHTNAERNRSIVSKTIRMSDLSGAVQKFDDRRGGVDSTWAWHDGTMKKERLVESICKGPEKHSHQIDILLYQLFDLVHVRFTVVIIPSLHL